MGALKLRITYILPKDLLDFIFSKDFRLDLRMRWLSGFHEFYIIK